MLNLLSITHNSKITYQIWKHLTADFFFSEQQRSHKIKFPYSIKTGSQNLVNDTKITIKLDKKYLYE